MPHLTLIYPAMGRKPGQPFIRSWQMEPLAMGRLAALTPKNWQIKFMDDRLEEIDYSIKTDLVALSIETYSARRGYEIADEFKKRNIPVVFGGYHATLCTEEVLKRGYSVCVGEAEPVWADLLQDAEKNELQPRYQGDKNFPLINLRPDRSIFNDKNYMPLALVETSRGCPFACHFCSISSFYQRSYRRRPVEEVIEELKSIPQKNIFFVDDNIVGNPASARELFKAIAPLNKKWVSQASLHALKDAELLKDMSQSGCLGVLVGFESLNSENLQAMGKPNNKIEEYREVLAGLRRHGIFVYGTFIFGYPHDTPASFDDSIRFAMEEKLYLAAFNNLVPFPGTPLYEEIKKDGQLRYEQWWLSSDFEFGQVPFHPAKMKAQDVEQNCHRARKEFYGWKSIFKRGVDFSGSSPVKIRSWLYWSLNYLLQKERTQKFKMRLGSQ